MEAHRFDRLLRLYPRAFRERYAAELREFLADDFERSRRRGGALWALRFWLRAYSDAVVSSVRVRLRGLTGYEMAAGRSVAVGARRRLMADAVQDVVQAGRGFRRHPAFHALTMVTVGLGVAATTAAFSVLDGVVRQPMPYPESGRLVRVWSAMRHNPDGVNPVSDPMVLSLRERGRSLESVVAVQSRERVLSGEGDPRRVAVTAGSAGVFELLGARAAAGRLFVGEDHEAGATPVAVLSWDVWTTRYGGSRDVVGRTITVDGELHEIVGVLSRDFVAPEVVAGSPEVWTALKLDPDATGSFGAAVLGRLSPGVSEAVAESEASELFRQAGEGDARWPILSARAVDLRTATIGSVGTTLWLFLGAVMLLLAIACTNVANLMLARGLDRTGEVGIRRALGASRSRLVRQMLVESLVIALAGGVAGVLLAQVLVSGFVAWAPGGIPRLAEVAVDGRALAFALTVSCVTGVLFGIAPAWTAVRQPRVAPVSGGRTTTAKATSRLRGALVVVEVAMALVLVLASGLLMNSFVRMRTVDPGFDADGLAAMRIDLRAGYSDRATWVPFWNELLERTAAIPGVQMAALSAFTPFLDFPMIQAFTPENAGIAPDESVFLPSVAVSPGWERTMGVRVVEGQSFDGSERSDGMPVVMVNRALANEYWPGQTDIVGRRLKSGSLSSSDDTWYTVVGVTSDVRHQLGSDPIATVYHPHEQLPWRTMSVLVRVQGDPASVLAAMRNVVREMDDGLPVQRIGPVTSFASESVTEPRFYSTLAAGFGILALILAVVGIHGTAAWTTARRSREIGIRLTLGARPGEVRTMLTMKALRLALLGAAIGSVAAVAGTRYLESYLFDLSPTDPVTFLATAAAVISTAAFAAWLPARRAARMDPATVLRSEN